MIYMLSLECTNNNHISKLKNFGRLDLCDVKIRSTISNYVLNLLSKSIHTKPRKIVILSTLADKIRFKSLLVRDNSRLVIRMDILPIIPRDLDTRKSINIHNIVDTLR